MDTEQVILGLLMSGPKSGYKIKNITGRLMMAYNLSLNQIYPALRKLEAANLVKKEVVIQTGKPNMHVYGLTPLGREAFYQAITAPPVPIDYQLDFLTRAFFFRFLGEEEVVRQFEQEISSLEEQLEDLEQIRPEVEARGEEDGLFIFSTIVDLIQTLRDRYTGELARRKKRLAGKGDGMT
ncbi:MAG TPA: PadR family transcriptional regulator [Deltaproteobacteria bacterium]|nr:PadR family transcriptional regulator [Deltaproteobacteria bacterium]HPP81839.1 PadR family transcriptional regulator [Deltaproteobacteria bacterium]